jgi:hypothetical protein
VYILMHLYQQCVMQAMMHKIQINVRRCNYTLVFLGAGKAEQSPTQNIEIQARHVTTDGLKNQAHARSSRWKV